MLLLRYNLFTNIKETERTSWSFWWARRGDEHLRILSHLRNFKYYRCIHVSTLFTLTCKPETLLWQFLRCHEDPFFVTLAVLGYLFQSKTARLVTSKMSSDITWLLKNLFSMWPYRSVTSSYMYGRSSKHKVADNSSLLTVLWRDLEQ